MNEFCNTVYLMVLFWSQKYLNGTEYCFDNDDINLYITHIIIELKYILLKELQTYLYDGPFPSESYLHPSFVPNQSIPVCCHLKSLALYYVLARSL